MPVALAEMNGQLRTGSNSILADTIIANSDCPNLIDCEGTTCILIDGQTLVQSIGKPAEVILEIHSQNDNFFIDIEENQSNLLQERNAQAKCIQ